MRLAVGVRAALDQLVMAVNTVDPDTITRGDADSGAWLCERFLAAYDGARRRGSGSYYTPPEVASELVRLVDEVVRHQVGIPGGLAAPGVTLIDPAMGVGTFLHTASDLITCRLRKGAGTARAGGGPRLVGIEHQLAAYTVARLHTTGRYTSGVNGDVGPWPGAVLYRADTLNTVLPLATPGLGPNTGPDPGSGSDGDAGTAVDAGGASPVPVVVVLGNPPIREGATTPASAPTSALARPGCAPWGAGTGPVLSGLDAFRYPGNGRTEHVLHNLTVYFARWAAWTAFEADPASHGIIALITTAAMLRGVGYRGLRAYLRRTCDEGWIVDLSPEGLRPAAGTRLFPTVQQPLAIAVFWRHPIPSETTGAAPHRPASIHYTALSGSRRQKLAQLRTLAPRSPRWRPVRPDWTAPFTPAATGRWDDFPALTDLMPYRVPGIKPNRTWVYAPCPSVLRARWRALMAAPLPQRRLLFRECGDRRLDTVVAPLPGFPPHTGTLAEERGDCPPPVRVCYRSFDRQWLIPDNRLLHRPSPRLWRAAHTGTATFLLTHRSRPLTSGPGIVLCALPPDTSCFKGYEAGPVLPTHHPTGAPNVAPGLLAVLARHLNIPGADPVPVVVEDLVAYLAAVLAHRGYTARFATELLTPGVRVPLTTDPRLWQRAVRLGRQVAWLHTYGERYTDTVAGRPAGVIAYPDGDRRRPRCTVPPDPQSLPERIGYDPGTQTLYVGAGVFQPVPVAVWAYDVGGMPIVRSWLARRQHRPRRAPCPGSPLDRHHRTGWSAAWTTELEDLLTLLRRLVELEPAQASLLDQILDGPCLRVNDLAAAGPAGATVSALVCTG